MIEFLRAQLHRAIEILKARARKHLDPRNEPVLTVYLASVLVRLAAGYGFDVDSVALSQVLEPFIAGAFVLARRLVTPNRKVEKARS